MFEQHMTSTPQIEDDRTFTQLMFFLVGIMVAITAVLVGFMAFITIKFGIAL